MTADPKGTAIVIRDLLASPARCQALWNSARSLFESHYHQVRYRSRPDHALSLN
jgi:hypothetical protein